MAIHEDYKAMLAAQALGALDAAEARMLETHLLDCAECRHELDEWQATAAMMALDSAPIAPSPRVRERIITAVRADKVVSLASRRPSSPAIPARFAIAAGLVLLALFASLLVLWQQNNAAKRELARLSEQTREAQQEAARQREVFEIVTSQGARVSQLAGTKEMPGAHGLLAYDLSGHAIMIVKGLPKPPAGKAYQLWFIAGAKPIPGRVFVTDALGEGALSDRMPAAAINASGFAITLEPEKGVQAPTGAVYLSSQS